MGRGWPGRLVGGAGWCMAVRESSFVVLRGNDLETPLRKEKRPGLNAHPRRSVFDYSICCGGHARSLLRCATVSTCKSNSRAKAFTT